MNYSMKCWKKLAKGNYEEVKEILNDVKQNLEKINHHGKEQMVL